MVSVDLSGLGRELSAMGAHSVLVFHGKASFDQAAYRPLLDRILAPYDVTYYADYQPNPSLTDIEHAIGRVNAVDPDVVLAIGGGSVMDTAKLARFFAQQVTRVEAYFLHHMPVAPDGPRSRLICMPTTSGTGSESTQFATFYMQKRKYSLDDPRCLPDVKVLDPLLVNSLPADIARQTGLDALCHALESFWAKAATPQSIEKALNALGLILQHLEARVLSPNAENRRILLNAASLAGEAIQVSRTTASHAISYPLTSVFQIPHGEAVALTIGQLLALNQDHIPELRKHRAVQVLKLTHFNELYERLSRLLARLQVHTQLASFGIQLDQAMPTILQYVSPERLSNNPRVLTEADIRHLLNGGVVA